LILRKIIEIVATRCQILWLKCTKFHFGSALDPAGGAYSAPPDFLDLRGLLKVREGRERKEGEGRDVRRGEGREKEERGKEGRGRKGR